MPTAGSADRLALPGDDEAHVWSTLLSEATACLVALAELLSPEEKQRAARFLRPDDRARYVAAHGILRQLLGRYLAVAPAALEFTTNAFGKPAVVPGAGRHPLSFNLAHSGNVILFVVAGGRRAVGVDVEAVRTDLDVMALAQGQFSPQEVDALQAVGESERAGEFFRCWTRKEAYVKARGEGLGFPLKQFSVFFGRDEPAMVRWVTDDPSASQRWSLFDLEPAPGHAGAVAIEGRPIRLVSRGWPPGG